METEHLREFITFSKTVNFARAADELFLSQPTLRAHVKALEDELGTPLTNRRNSKLELSPAGKLLSARARDILEVVRLTTEECIAACSEYGSITIGTLGCAWFEEILYAARANFRAERPGRQMEVQFASGMHANLEALMSGEEDALLYPHIRSRQLAKTAHYRLPDSFRCLHLKSESHTFWMTRDNPLFDKEQITAKDLSGCSLLVANTRNMTRVAESVQRRFTEADTPIEIRTWPFANYNEYFFAGSAETFGIYMRGISPDLETRSNFRVFVIEDLDLINDVCLVWDEDRLNSCGRAFMDEVRALVARRTEPPAAD